MSVDIASHWRTNTDTGKHRTAYIWHFSTASVTSGQPNKIQYIEYWDEVLGTSIN
jgi:hypothetical protein